MANYLALIRKADFVDLYKYGSLHINKDLTRQFTGNVEELPKKEAIFNDLTYFANAFDSTFTYLFLHYENNLGRINDINIADVRGIYPLDNEAKTELSLSLDPRIKINAPLWPDAVFNLQKKQSIQDCKNGASNIWKIYNLPESIEETEQIVNKKILTEVVDELYENRHPSGKRPIWVYIMRYERHAFYPPNTIGAFMDAVNAIFNYMAGREVDSAEIESTMIMRFLAYCNEQMPNMQFDEILQKLDVQAEPKIVQFIKTVEEIETNVDLLKAASLFFIYRNRYKENFIYEEKWEQVGKKYGKEFSVACYMLGCILGHEHTYDCMYEHLPLAIFKEQKIDNLVEIPNEENQITEGKSSDESIIEETSKEGLLEEKSAIPGEIKIETSPEPRMTNETERKINTKVLPHFPCKMGKPKRGGGFAKSPKPKKVANMDEYLKLENQGWKEIKEDKKLW